MIRVTHHQFRRQMADAEPRYLAGVCTHTELVDQITVWFLFIPIYRTTRIIKTSI